MNSGISNEAPHPGDSVDIETRLWDYIDGFSSATEKSVVEKLIQTNLEWKSKYGELLEVHQLMFSSDLEAPSMRFSKNVMEEIGKYQISPAAKNYIDKRVIWGITAFFFAMIAGVLVYGFGQIDWSTSDGSINKYISLDKIDYSKFFNNTFMNVFMMMNVILGLMLVDRYLANKRKKYSKEA